MTLLIGNMLLIKCYRAFTKHITWSVQICNIMTIQRICHILNTVPFTERARRTYWHDRDDGMVEHAN